jgi:hypothetical protein
MSQYTRDDPRYWQSRPADHNDAGLFIGGPEGTHNSLAPLVQTPVCPYTPDTPNAARARMNATRAYRRMVIARQVNFVRLCLTPRRGSFAKGMN